MAVIAAVPKSRIDALTGLRFFAALVVYLSHHPKPAYFPDWLTTLFLAGYNGVTIFFVLSGFVIGVNYFESLAQPNSKSLARFFIARLARIYPLYFLVLLYIWMDQGAPLGSGIALHFLALQTWSPDVGFAYAFNGPGWSIGVEFFLYAAFPLIVLLINPLKRNKIALWLIAIGAIGVMVSLAVFFVLTGRGSLPYASVDSAHRWLYRTPITRLGDFVLGVIAALLFREISLSKTPSYRRWSWICYACIIGIVLFMLWPANMLSVISWDVAYSPFAFLLILGIALTSESLLARFLGSRVVVKLGEASFALYLIHVPMMRIFGIERYLDYEPWVAIPLWLVFGGICIALSISLNTLVETPARRLINGWTEKLIRERPPTSNGH